MYENTCYTIPVYRTYTPHPFLNYLIFTILIFRSYQPLRLSILLSFYY